MTEEEKMQFLARIMGNGNTTIGQVIVDNHGTMNIHNHANEQKNKQKDEGISKEQLNKAILDVQDIFWANSSYAVLFCVCRDCFGMPDNRSQFERMIDMLPNRAQFTRQCTPGVISSTINDNPYMNLPIEKWQNNGAPERVIKLVDKFKNAIEIAKEE